MTRKIIKIDESLCNGCGACAAACHEGAIGMENGKAKLLRDDYCDGLGDCLPACPTNAISFEEREAAAYDEKAVEEHKRQKASNSANSANSANCAHSGCPGARAAAILPKETTSTISAEIPSELRQWPVQIKLAPTSAPYFDGAKLLVAADCTAFAYGDFHRRFMRGYVTLIGCPKLDSIDYSEKLAEIIRNNDIKSVTIVRMEVPCCGGLENAVKKALQASGKFIPWSVAVISTDGKILD